jgi:hemolysin activation/secretion protein
MQYFLKKLDAFALVSVGLGLRLQLSDRFTARLDWGIPLVDLSTRQRT